MRFAYTAASAAALAALAACADVPTDPAAPSPPRAALAFDAAPDSAAADAAWTFADSATAPVWLAYQDGDGAWKRVAARLRGDSVSYEFTVRGRGGVAVVTRTQGAGETGSEDGYELAVYYGTAAELALFGRCQAGPAAPAGGKTLTGTVAGGGMMDQATISLGSAVAMVMPMQSAYTLRDVAGGPQDLLAALSSFSLEGPTPSLALSKLVIRRAVDLADGAAIPAVDFAGDEAFAPASAALTVEGAAGARIASTVAYRTVGGSTGMLSFGMGGDRYYGVPSARQVAGDLHVLTVMALPAGIGEGEEEESPLGGAGTMGDGVRAVLTHFAEARDRTVTLGPELPAAEVTAIGGGAHARWRAKLPRQSEYAAGLIAQFGQDEAGRHVSVTVTAGYAGDAAAWEPTVPDLSSVDGFDARWAPRGGAPVRWALAAYGGDFAAAALRGFVPEDGQQYRFAVRAGTGAAARR